MRLEKQDHWEKQLEREEKPHSFDAASGFQKRRLQCDAVFEPDRASCWRGIPVSLTALYGTTKMRCSFTPRAALFPMQQYGLKNKVGFYSNQVNFLSMGRAENTFLNFSWLAQKRGLHPFGDGPSSSQMEWEREWMGIYSSRQIWREIYFFFLALQWAKNITIVRWHSAIFDICFKQMMTNS